MKDTEARPESISGRLADYLESHKDATTNEWAERVRKDPGVPAGSMTKLEIIDHLPLIFDLNKFFRFLLQSELQHLLFGNLLFGGKFTNVKTISDCPPQWVNSDRIAGSSRHPAGTFESTTRAPARA